MGASVPKRINSILNIIGVNSLKLGDPHLNPTSVLRALNICVFVYKHDYYKKYNSYQVIT